LDVRRAAAYEQLEFQIDELVASAVSRVTRLAMVRQAAPVDRPAPLTVVPPLARETFGHWLLGQKNRGDGIDELATAARTDPGFPRNGTPADVRARLRRVGAPDDAFEQVDDAELCWKQAG
jgi:hypothetical protein